MKNKKTAPDDGVAEDIAAIKTGIEMLSKQHKDASDIFERYRTDVHTRFEKTGNTINLGDIRLADKLEAETRRIDAVEHDIKNTALLLKEFKEFGKDITLAISEIKEYIIADKAKSGMGAKILEHIFKLATFGLTVIGIITYLKQ